jgi:hypothetical protein
LPSRRRAPARRSCSAPGRVLGAELGERGEVFEVNRTSAGALHADQIVATGDCELQLSELDLQRTAAKLLISG